MLFTEAELKKMTKKQLSDILRLVKVSGFSVKTKPQLVVMVMDADKAGKLKYIEEEKVIREIRTALGLTNDPRASRTKGIRKSFKDDAKSPTQLADEALSMMRRIQEKGKPRMRKKFKADVDKMMSDFEKRIADTNAKLTTSPLKY